MQTVSKEFISAMEDHPYTARITIDGRDTIQGNAVKEIFFRGGANSSEDNILLGSAFSASVEITLDKDEVSCAIEGRELFVELGLDLPTATEWLPMGKYTAQNPLEADGILSVTAFDALGAKFDVEYEPIEGFDFNSENGVSSVAFLQSVCDRRHVQVDTASLDDFALKGKPDGFTERQIIGFISALYGGFANVDRMGVLRIRRYAAVDTTISPENYYEDGLQKATYSFNPGWMKSHNEAADLTMFVGDMNAQQGINLESIWMTQAILNRLWEEFQGFTYHPVPELSFLGNPLIDPGDILQLEDSSGDMVSVPVMAITHEYDGGILTSIAAYGQAKTSDYQGPTRRAVFRSAENASSSAKAYTDAENKKLNQLELLKRLTKDWVDDGIYLDEEGRLAINASAILTGVLAASLIQTGVLKSQDGKTFFLDLDGGVLKGAFTELSIAGKTVDEVAQGKVNAQTQMDIFNKLTNNGACQGMFIQDGQLYINASYIKSGIIDAALVQVINLIAEQLKSVKDTSTLSITGAALKMLSGNNQVVKLDNEYADESNAYPRMYMSDYRDGENTDNAEFSPHHIKIGGTSMLPTFAVYARGNSTGQIGEVMSEMHVDSINPGKKVLYSGAVSVGSTFTVPKTSYYDLFAIKLQDSNGGNSPVVLAYKYGNTIYGVGGWCGTETLYKELYFVSATFSGNTWTLVDAGLHDVYESGGLSDSTRLQLKEVIGVI